MDAADLKQLCVKCDYLNQRCDCGGVNRVPKERVLKDFFGNKLRVGQRVLRISRVNSNLRCDVDIVTQIVDKQVWTRMAPTTWNPTPRISRVLSPERLVIHPEDLK